MANIAREGNEIVLNCLAASASWRSIATCVSPLRTVKSVDAVDEPNHRIQGLKPRNFKALGGYWPGRFAYPLLSLASERRRPRRWRRRYRERRISKAPPRSAPSGRT
jgi:hypothetical protein